ncbi:MAG: hypothetical protein JW976_00155 [Syntrophaceae bacterium]|nr:hypothetical protein [Syntrophaceae bacterium]
MSDKISFLVVQEAITLYIAGTKDVHAQYYWSKEPHKESSLGAHKAGAFGCVFVPMRQ